MIQIQQSYDFGEKYRNHVFSDDLEGGATALHFQAGEKKR